MAKKKGVELIKLKPIQIINNNVDQQTSYDIFFKGQGFIIIRNVFSKE